MRTTRIIAVTFSAILIASGCHKRVPVTALPPVASPDPAVVALDDANRSFIVGSYDEAARGYENYLKLDASGPRRDEALFHLALSFVLRPSADWPRASSIFRQIMEDFPNSPFKAPAGLILSLHADLDQVNASAQQRDLRIRQLTTELDRLKKIDADRRKRP
jgi:hypothetical protein